MQAIEPVTAIDRSGDQWSEWLHDDDIAAVAGVDVQDFRHEAEIGREVTDITVSDRIIAGAASNDIIPAVAEDLVIAGAETIQLRAGARRAINAARRVASGS